MGRSYNRAMAPVNTFIDAVIPSDTEDLPHEVSVLRVHGTGGDIKVRTALGDDRTFHAVEVGACTPPVQIRRVFVEGTTAVGIEGY